MVHDDASPTTRRTTPPSSRSSAPSPTPGSPTTPARPTRGSPARWPTEPRAPRRSGDACSPSCRTPGCWCRWSRCSARSRSTSRASPTTRPPTWRPCWCEAPTAAAGLLAFTSDRADGHVGPGGAAGAGAGATAATAAVQDGAAALVVDVAGPASYVVDGRRPDPARRRVAAGRHRRRLGAVTAGLARRRNDPLTFGVDRSVHHASRDTDPAKRRHAPLVPHPHRSPAPQIVGSRSGVTRANGVHLSFPARGDVS